MVQCFTGNHPAEIYYEAIVTSPGDTRLVDGYACSDHEPTWETIQSGLDASDEVLKFRTRALADTDLWTKGEVLDEYNPTQSDWGDNDE